MWSDARRGKWWYIVWIATGGEVQRDGARGGGCRAGGGGGGEQSKSRNAGR